MMHPYTSVLYAQAFGPGYSPLYLPQARTHVLQRCIPDTEYTDAMGCYPLSPVADADLEKDFALLRKQGAVSLVWVSDPFFHSPLEAMQRYFDIVRPYKEHYLHDFTLPRGYSKHHRYEVRRALGMCEVRRIALADYLREWCGLYRALIDKHAIQGVQAFSDTYFAALCALEPVMFGAFQGGALMGALLCFAHEDYAYSHLAASSEEGYRLRVSYALYDAALCYFAENGVRQFDLGGGAGVEGASAGLSFFKQGFSNAGAMCHLCGKILDAELYTHLSAGKNTSFFPAYRV